MAQNAWGDEQTKFFFDLTPEVILQSVEACGLRATGRVLPLNSLENRVYEVEVETDGPPEHPWDALRVIKFYRPGRWSREQIQEEHTFLHELFEAELPVVAPVIFPDGESVFSIGESGIYAALFPKVGGRVPDEVTDDQAAQIGRLVARVHLVGAQHAADHRLQLDIPTYALSNLEYLLSSGSIAAEHVDTYEKLVREIVRHSEPLFKQFPSQRIHGDLHAGNLLWGSRGLFMVDFDDMVTGPCIQDIWLLSAGRDTETLIQRDIMLDGYEQMRTFNRGSVVLVEPLRALRLIHFSAWIAKRFEDPAFKRAFSFYGTSAYWGEQVGDLRDQLRLICGGEI